MTESSCVFGHSDFPAENPRTQNRTIFIQTVSHNMRITIVIIYLLSVGLVNAQTLNNFGKTPERIEKSITTDELLKKLNWQSIKEFCKSNDGFYSYERNNGLLTEYEYVKQGRVESFEIISFNGYVLEFYFDIPQSKRTNEHFFDKKLWLQYVNEMIPELPDSLLLTEDEPTDLLKGFYRLLGVDAVDEYGWICEYSTVGMPPKRRQGVISLIENNRIDLLRKLMNHSNPQIKLYAIDALIYLDNQSNILTDKDWQSIFEFRDSRTTIRTCGNMGSYKFYETPIADLLSKKAIKDIPKSYKMLKGIGYLNK